MNKTHCSSNPALELAAAGAAIGCAHNKGMLGLCLVLGAGVAQDAVKGLALGRESAASGSMWWECAALKVCVLRRMTQRLLNSIVLQRARGMQALSTFSWGPCFWKI